MCGSVLLCVFRIGGGVVVAGFLVGMFVECICIGMYSLVCEVENGGRIDGHTHESGFKMQMCAE